MKVFISWSGALSGRVAQVLGEWIEDVLQDTKSWISNDDIDKGSLWFGEISGQLADTSVGIVVLTKENVTAPWVLFETGALSKGLSKSRVCPLLVDLKYTDLKPPLSQFNATIPEKEDMLRLIKAINAQNQDNKLVEEKVDRAFEKWWDEFKKKFYAVLKNHKSPQKTERPSEDMIAEILEISRSIQTNIQESTSKFGFGTKQELLDILPGIKELDKKVTKVDQEIEFLKFQEHSIEEVLLGNFYSQGLQEYEEALKYYNLALDKSPRNEYALIRKGFVLKRLGKVQDAFDTVDRLTKEWQEPKTAWYGNPWYSTAWYNRACYGAILGHEESEILCDLQKAISFFSAYREFAARDPDFERIRDDEEFQRLIKSE